jgi:putative glutamine amidotransferase
MADRPPRDRPVIGIAACVERARWSVWDSQALLVPRNYADAVQKAGGLVMILAPDPEDERDPDAVLDLVDGVMLCGGVDLDPGRYGAERHALTDPAVPDRDGFELALAARAIERDVPMLGICRGMQVMNVAKGGTLSQHLPEDFGHEDHRRVIGTFDGADHDVELADGSLAARSAGETHHATKSHHHQGVAKIGAGFTVTGWSDLDELPEAIEREDNRFALGVQWHPEADTASLLIGSLVEEARTYRAERLGRAA